MLLAATALLVVHFHRDREGSATKAQARAFFGMDVPQSSVAQFDALAHKIGERPTVFPYFIKLDSSAGLAALRQTPADATPFITVEPWSQADRRGNVEQPLYSLTALASGAHDEQLRRIARAVRDLRRPAYLRFAHEMNGNWYPWAASVNGNTPEDYVAAWRHVHIVMAPVLGDAVRWVWSPNVVNGVAADAPAIDDFYPGNAYVDDVGFTGYSHGASVSATFCPSMRAVQALTSKPVVLSEIGFAGPGKARWLTELGRFVRANPAIAGFIYYNTSAATTDASGDYRIDQSAADLAAMRTAVKTARGASSSSLAAAYRCDGAEQGTTGS